MNGPQLFGGEKHFKCRKFCRLPLAKVFAVSSATITEPTVVSPLPLFPTIISESKKRQKKTQAPINNLIVYSVGQFVKELLQLYMYIYKKKEKNWKKNDLTSNNIIEC